jgi:YfiH family protein
MQPDPKPATPQLDLLHAPAFAALPWLHHAFTARAGGLTTVYGRPDDLNLGLTKEDDPDIVQQNRRHLAQDPKTTWRLTNTRQIHSPDILHVTPDSQPLPPADGLTTAHPAYLIAIHTADSVPILLADTRTHAVAALHAGWRGTVARIAEQGVATMHRLYHSDPAHLIAAIGPSIGPCCYHVGEEVHTRFHETFPYADQLFANSHLNLWESNRQQLLAAGLPPQNITTLAQCTACATLEGRRRFFSHRADHGITGRMMSVIGIR